MAEKADYFSISNKPKIKLLSKRSVFIKLLFTYSLLYSFSFVLGFLLFKNFSFKSNSVFNTHIKEFFSVEFSQYKNISEAAKSLFEISRTDISHLIIILISGFTLFVGTIISILLVFKGVSQGFSLSYLTYAAYSNNVTLRHGILSIIMYSLTLVICVAIMIYFCIKTTFFIYEFKSLCGIPRKVIRSKALYSQFFRFLIAFGAIIILNLIRCIL